MLRYIIFIIAITIAPVLTKKSSSGGKTHTYPSSTGYSGTGHGGTQTHSYPSSNGMSGNRNAGTHTHYHYHAPQQINYHGQSHYPVYHGQPPAYVYQYRSSGSRFDTLLVGLALYNLGTMSRSHDYHRSYRGHDNENCRLGVRKENGDYEETRIECRLMTSFIWEEERKVTDGATSTVTNTTITKIISNAGNNTLNDTEIIQTNITVNAVDIKGPSIEVTPGMQCYLIRNSPMGNMRKSVPCGLLRTYALQSFRNNAFRALSENYLLFITLSIFCFY